MLDKLYGLKISSRWQVWYILPIVVILVALVVMLSIGLPAGSAKEGINIGLDFEGGTQITVDLGDEALGNAYNENVNKLTKAIEVSRTVEYNGESVSVGAPDVSYVQRISQGGSNAIRIKYKNITDDSNLMRVVNQTICDEIYALYNVNPETNTYFVTYRSTSATATTGLLKDAILAASIAIVLIMVYIIIRFELFSGISAVVALIHDIIIMFALTVIFQIEINSSYIAAIVTIVAYSINNTIVVFDRVREQKKTFDAKHMNYAFVADDAIIKTLSRTMFTSITTMIMVIFLAILGVPTMREFTLPILFGLVAGTYSSMFIAAPTWAAINNGLIKYRMRKYAKYKAIK